MYNSKAEVVIDVPHHFLIDCSLVQSSVALITFKLSIWGQTFTMLQGMFYNTYRKQWRTVSTASKVDTP